MKYQVLFSLKNNEKVFINVVCCSRDWPFKGLKAFLLCKIKMLLHEFHIVHCS